MYDFSLYSTGEWWSFWISVAFAILAILGGVSLVIQIVYNRTHDGNLDYRQVKRHPYRRFRVVWATSSVLVIVATFGVVISSINTWDLTEIRASYLAEKAKVATIPQIHHLLDYSRDASDRGVGTVTFVRTRDHKICRQEVGELGGHYFLRGGADCVRTERTS